MKQKHLSYYVLYDIKSGQMTEISQISRQRDVDDKAIPKNCREGYQ